jgi:NDP-sugar pyrophosphorylase family protein
MKLFITTSGIGSRLYELTKYTNKSMIKIGKKPVISYIIDEYPEDIEIVVSLGYYGDHVKQYLELAYPNRKIQFVEVDNYAGPGSSQVYSQLCAKQYLQEPFIYHDCDTIIENLQQKIPMNFNYNFIVGYKTNCELYDAFDYDEINNNVIKTYMKPDSLEGMAAYVGIVGVYDYKLFWKHLEKAYKEVTNVAPHDFMVYHKYQMFKNLKAIIVDNWTDTGNVASVKEARKKCKDKFQILDKNDQAIFIINNKVIKFFAKDGVVNNIMTHYSQISKFCNKISLYTNNFLVYDYIDAENAIHCMNPVRFNKMLNYFNDEGLWEEQTNVNIDLFNECKDKFYIDKTLERINTFKNYYKISEDQDIYINDILIPSKFTIEYMLNEFKKHPSYLGTKPSNWHGDFVLDNMLYKDEKFILLDWREKFDDIIMYGDRNYDFAKMNHNLTFNFSSAYKELFNITEDDNKIYISILTDNYVYECKKILAEFVETKYNVSFNYINFITGLCWVNMSPLHMLNPVCKLLFYMGKLTMYQSLIEIQKQNF